MATLWRKSLCDTFPVHSCKIPINRFNYTTAVIERKNKDLICRLSCNASAWQTLQQNFVEVIGFRTQTHRAIYRQGCTKIQRLKGRSYRSIGICCLPALDANIPCAISSNIAQGMCLMGWPRSLHCSCWRRLDAAPAALLPRAAPSAPARASDNPGRWRLAPGLRRSTSAERRRPSGSTERNPFHRSSGWAECW